MTEPGVLPCGCLWDGTILSIEQGCAVDDHDLGHLVAYVKHRLSVGGLPLDQTEWPVRRPWTWDG